MRLESLEKVALRPAIIYNAKPCKNKDAMRGAERGGGLACYFHTRAVVGDSYVEKRKRRFEPAIFQKTAAIHYYAPAVATKKLRAILFARP